MNAIDPQRLRAAMDAVDPVDADAAFAARAPSASPSATPSPTASGTAPVAADRLITPQGVGVLRVGMTMEEGIQLGVSTDQGEYCGPWDMSEEGFRRYPGVWAYWSGQLNSLAITPKPGQDESVIPGLEYATAEGIRVQDTFADVRAAYGERAVEWTSDAEHWAGIDDVSLPNVPPREGEPLVPQLDGLLVRDGDRALVFLGNDGVIEYIVATSIDDEGKAQVVHGS